MPLATSKGLTLPSALDDVKAFAANTLPTLKDHL